MGSFVQRRLRFDFTLQTGSFNENGADTVSIVDIKSSVNIEQVGGYQASICTLELFGLSKKLMDRLTVNNRLTNSISKNTVAVWAGTDDTDMTVIFRGDIFSAYADFSNAPNVPFIVNCQIGFVDVVKPAAPLYFKGAVDIAVIAKSIAASLGCELDDSYGVKGVLNDAYYEDTNGKKLKKFQQDAGIDVYYTPPTLAIMPKGIARNTGLIPIISDQTGLVDYPMMDMNGSIIITVLYNPKIFHGCIIDLHTSYPNCTGQFFVLSMFHDLTSQTPNGAWFTRLILIKYDMAASSGRVY